jgi:hypothetical protein
VGGGGGSVGGRGRWERGCPEEAAGGGNSSRVCWNAAYIGVI